MMLRSNVSVPVKVSYGGFGLHETVGVKSVHIYVQQTCRPCNQVGLHDTDLLAKTRNRIDNSDDRCKIMKFQAPQADMPSDASSSGWWNYMDTYPCPPGFETAPGSETGFSPLKTTTFIIKYLNSRNL